MKKVSIREVFIMRCSNCGSKNVIGMSRVVGYYSIIENWNDSKQAELRDRKNGNYKISI